MSKHKLPTYHHPAALAILKELGFTFHHVRHAAMFNGEETHFADAAGTVIVLERTRYSQTVYHLGVKKGELNHSGYDGDGLHKPYPKEFDPERFLAILDRWGMEATRIVRTKRLNALLN